MNIEESILREWEKAGGEYELAAKLVRKDLEKERAKERKGCTPKNAKRINFSEWAECLKGGV